MRIHVIVVPWAKKEGIEEMTDLAGLTVYKIKLRARPVQWEANAALIEFLHTHSHVPKKDIHIMSGHTSRHKLIDLPDC